jgi:hypothetical protein
MMKEPDFRGPLQQHFEYPLGGANDGKSTIDIPQAEVFATLNRDLETLQAQLLQTGL